MDISNLRRAERDLERLAAATPGQMAPPGGNGERRAILGSLALRGASLTERALAALLDEGRAIGGRPLLEYVVARDFAEAAGAVARLPARRRDGRLFGVDEIVEIHRRAARSSAEDAGRWRSTRADPSASGVVHPPPWLIPAEMRSVAEHLGRPLAAGESALERMALLHARLDRIAPFASGNGRVARLLLDLVARRIARPPLTFRARDARAYASGRQAAARGDIAALARIIGSAMRTTLEALPPPAGARPLTEMFPAERLAAAYKAAQRGRLRTVRIGGRRCTTAAWRRSYEKESAPLASE